MPLASYSCFTSVPWCARASSCVAEEGCGSNSSTLQGGPSLPCHQSGSRARCHLPRALTCTCPMRAHVRPYLSVLSVCLRMKASSWGVRPLSLGQPHLSPSLPGAFHLEFLSLSSAFFHSSSCLPSQRAHSSSLSWHAGSFLSLEPYPFSAGLLKQPCKLSDLLPPCPPPFVLPRKSLSISLAGTEYYRLGDLQRKTSIHFLQY